MLLSQMLSVVRAGHYDEALRAAMYGALLSYLHFCRGPGIASLPPSVLQALLQGCASCVGVRTYRAGMLRVVRTTGVLDRGDVARVVAELDEAQTELDEGNAELLQQGPFLLDLLVRDAVSASQQPVWDCDEQTIAPTLT